MKFRVESEVYHAGVGRRSIILGWLTALATASACGDETASTTPPPRRVEDSPFVRQDLVGRQKPTYETPLEMFPGLPKVDPQHLSSMIEALKKASHPFLNKIGRNISTLQSITTIPPEFPFWVHSASIPMPIVYNDTTVSKATYDLRVSDRTPERKFRSNTYEYDMFDNPALGISLGISQAAKNLGPLAEAYLLAKEHITHMVNLRAAMEFMDYLERDATYIGIKDVNGQPFTDRTKRERVGMTYFLNQFSSHDTPIWRIFDAYPTLLLGLILHYVIDKGELPRTISGGFMPFYAAANIVQQSDRQLAQMMADTMTGWLKDDSLLPPAGTGLKILRSEHISQASSKLQDELAELGLTTK